MKNQQSCHQSQAGVCDKEDNGAINFILLWFESRRISQRLTTVYTAAIGLRASKRWLPNLHKSVAPELYSREGPRRSKTSDIRRL
jgi:hypothetical protein